MKGKEKHCWNCLDEDRCDWPPECVCERWRPDPHESSSAHATPYPLVQTESQLTGNKC